VLSEPDILVYLNPITYSIVNREDGGIIDGYGTFYRLAILIFRYSLDSIAKFSVKYTDSYNINYRRNVLTFNIQIT
jgi:hypothetical protein